MTNSQNPKRAESAAGWVRAPECPSRSKYLLIALICLALVVGVFVVAHGKSAAATRRHQASAAAAQSLRTWASGNLSALPAQTVTGSATVAQAYAFVDLALGIATKPGGAAAASPTPTPPTAGVPTQTRESCRAPQAG
ncbi:MAG TPA: hypothetical protein VFE92_19250 [Dermatophilaceae bacterium]|nr:hypothetical protein [Dermatophilaceae bacterium]